MQSSKLYLYALGHKDSLDFSTDKLYNDLIKFRKKGGKR